MGDTVIGARLIDLFSQLPPLPAHEGPNRLLKIATPEAEGDSAKAPPSMATRQAEAAVLTSLQRSRVEERLAERPLLPGAIGTGSDGPKDVPMAPFGGAARRQAAQVLSGGAPVSADDPYVRAQRQVGEQLDRLGLRPRSEARIHIDEHLIEHGAGVTRAAAGETSLLRGGEVTLKTGAPANALARATLSEDQLARLESLPAREDRLRRGDGDLAEVVELGVDHLERQLLDKKVRIAGINRAVPNDGKLTLVNTSWGDNVYVVAESQAAYLGHAPEGSRQHQEATRLLGYPPKGNLTEGVPRDHR